MIALFLIFVYASKEECNKRVKQMSFLTKFIPLIALISMGYLYADEMSLSETPVVEQTYEEKVAKVAPSSLDLKQVFSASPIIYSILFFMSVSALGIWLYSLITFRQKDIIPDIFVGEVRKHLCEKNYDQALLLCESHNHFFSNIIASGISSRKHGAEVMIDSMKSEGKRASASFWQRLSLLNDIAVIAPMFGLLGTVIGMFYSFYDVNRSIESINALFDGLGIAVGTTVSGLIVAITAMVFYTTLKYRLVKTLSLVENEALSLSSLIDIPKTMEKSKAR